MRHRPFRVDDFIRCVPLLPAGFKASPRVREALLSIWARLLDEGQLLGGVVVDPESSRTDAVVAFGMSAFVEDAFMDDYLRRPQPYISAIVYERILSGRSPLLPVGAIASANRAGSLSLLILHFGIRLSDPPTSYELAVIAKAHTGFRLSHEGYHLRRVVQEVYGPAQIPFMLAGGFRLENDFPGIDAEHAPAPPKPEEWPYLMAVEASDPGVRLPGSATSYLFQRLTPRFGFAPAEQRVLIRTLMDETDESIASALGISRDAVKKTWRRIYQRVAAVDPALLDGQAETGGSDDAGSREKRHRLIGYLRYHLEELRPFKEGVHRDRRSMARR